MACSFSRRTAKNQSPDRGPWWGDGRGRTLCSCRAPSDVMPASAIKNTRTPHVHARSNLSPFVQCRIRQDLLDNLPKPWFALQPQLAISTRILTYAYWAFSLALHLRRSATRLRLTRMHLQSPLQSVAISRRGMHVAWPRYATGLTIAMHQYCSVTYSNLAALGCIGCAVSFRHTAQQCKEVRSMTPWPREASPAAHIPTADPRHEAAFCRWRTPSGLSMRYCCLSRRRCSCDAFAQRIRLPAHRPGPHCCSRLRRSLAGSLRHQELHRVLGGCRPAWQHHCESQLRGGSVPCAPTCDSCATLRTGPVLAACSEHWLG